MDPQRFQNTSAGRVIRLGQGETEYWAFVPNPLPPELIFDPELVKVLSEADRALGELAGLGRTLPNPNLLIRPFISREAVLSSRIEGTQADIADLYAYQAQLPSLEATPTLGPADVVEVANYVRALDYGLERVKTLPVSLRLMRELHERLMAGVRGGQVTPGEFRRSQNWIGSSDSNPRQAAFVPPPVPEMEIALDRLEKYLHAADTYPPLIRLALIHYQFEAIHPFLDGNGRIGRLLISLLLLEWGLLPLPLLYLSAYFEQRRQEYYERLLAISERGAWPEWLVFFLRGVMEQARDAILRAKHLQDLQQGWRLRLQTKRRTSTSLLQLVDELFRTPAVTVPHVQKLLGVTHRAASQMVTRLVAEGILHPVPGAVRNRQFVAREIMGVLGENLTT